MTEKLMYQAPLAHSSVIRTSRVMMSSVVAGSADSFGSESGSYGNNSGEGYGTENGEW